MDSHSRTLPVDVVERMLSFLSIPNVCRMRVVCKEWNELTTNATFHALCDENRKNKEYLFLWRKDNILATGPKTITSSSSTTIYFFDLDIEHWYSIPSTRFRNFCVCNPKRAFKQWFLSMDDGLVCGMVPFRGSNESTLSLSLMDPVAKTWRGLPSPNLVFLPPRFGDIDPSLVTVVDHVTRCYRIYFFNVLKNMSLATMYDSSTQEWQPVGGLPHPMDNAIAFQNNIFASQTKGALAEHLFQFSLFRYEEDGDSFAKVWHMNFQRRVVFSKLLVRHNRLFFLVTTRLPRSILISDSDSDCEPEPEACFPTCQDEKGPLFEMYEILLDEGSSKPVVQFTEDAMHAVWGGEICTNFWFAFPCFDANGGYSSVVLMHHHTGEIRRFHLATGAVDVLPACPLSTTIPHAEFSASTFDAKTMPLSFRDVLKHTPPSQCRLVFTCLD